LVENEKKLDSGIKDDYTEIHLAMMPRWTEPL